MEIEGRERARTVRKLLPVSPFNCDGLERWFGHLAEQGLFVIKTGYYLASFKKGEPAARTYSLEPFDLYDKENQWEMEKRYRLAGWEVAGQVYGKFTIFSAENGRAERVEPEEAIRKSGKNSLRKSGWTSLISAALDGVLTVIWCNMIFGKYGFWYAATLVTPFILCILLVFGLVVNIFWRIGDCVSIRRYLKGGEGARRERSGLGKGRRTALLFAIAVTVLGLLVMINGELNSWHQELGELKKSLPVPALDEISPDNRLMGGTADFHSSIVAPVQYEVVQQGKGAVILRFQYMETASSWLAQPILRGLMLEKMAWTHKKPEAVESRFFDQAYEAEISENMHYFFGLSGNTIVAACYIGQGYDAGFEERLHGAMTDWTEPEAFREPVTEWESQTE